MTGDNTLIHSHGINRRDFMKLCAALAATMGLSSKAAAEMAESVTNPQRPPVIWIGAQECTGCTESLLRATHPTVENLVLETISLEYHEVLSAAFGHQVEENKHNALEKYKGQYVLVVDGSIPLKITVFIAWLPVSRLWITSAKRRKAQQPLSLSVPALRGAVLPQLELTQLAQSACKKFYRAKPLSIFLAARRTRTTSSRPLRTSSLTANRRNWMTKTVRLSPMVV